MNRCLGIMFQNEAHWLSLHLPHLVSENYDIVMLDGGSTDDSAMIADEFATVISYHQFNNNWSEQVNSLIELGLKRNYKYMLRLDPDELMFRDEIDAVFNLLEYQRYQSVALPRFNFEFDRNHYSKELFPDYQTRGFELSEVSFSGKVHERINLPPITIDSCCIYHYEGLNNMQYRTLKGINYKRIADGLPVLDSLPRDIAAQPMNYRPHVPFLGQQPVEFKNARAPF